MAKINFEKFKATSNLTIYNPPPPETEEVYGRYNFTGDRLRRFKTFCAKNNLQVDNVLVQTDFLLTEIKKDGGKAFRASTTIEEAARIFHNEIINSGDPNLTVDAAYEILDRTSI